MTKTYHDQDADLSLIQAKKVAIIGYSPSPMPPNGLTSS
jgi:ketol-acid reductoisomerase